MYRDAIRESAARAGYAGIDPAWIEAWMRLESGTLDALSPRQFDAEVKAAIECIQASSEADNRALAASFGL